MKKDYVELDKAILAEVAKDCVSFSALVELVANHSEALATPFRAPGWRIVDRRLQALRKAGHIRYQRKLEGWIMSSPVIGAAK